MSYAGHSLRGGSSPLQRCSQCIQQLQLTGSTWSYDKKNHKNHWLMHFHSKNHLLFKMTHVLLTFSKCSPLLYIWESLHVSFYQLPLEIINQFLFYLIKWNFYHQGFSDYCLHLYYYFHNASADMSSGLLQVFVELGNLYGTSNYVLYWIHRSRLFWFR